MSIHNSANSEVTSNCSQSIGSPSSPIPGKLSAKRLDQLAPLFNKIFPFEELSAKEGLLIRKKNGKAFRLIGKAGDIFNVGNKIGTGQAKEIRELTLQGKEGLESSKDFVYAERRRELLPYCQKAWVANRQINSDLTIGNDILEEIERIQSEPESFSPEIQHGANCLVKVFGGKEYDEVSPPCLLMERLNGSDLETHPSKLTEQQIAQFAYDTFCALALLHSVGIVHRDVKPENIFLIDGNGGIKLGDYGLCTRWEDDIVTTNAIIGTPIYLPPEYADTSSRIKEKRHFHKIKSAEKLHGENVQLQKMLQLKKTATEKRDTWAAALSYLLVLFNEKGEPKWKKGKFRGANEYYNFLRVINDQKIQSWCAYDLNTNEKRVFRSEIEIQLVSILLEGLKVKVNERPTAEEMAQKLGTFLQNFQ